MPLLIPFLIIALPVVEITLFIQVGGWLGLWPTLGLVVLAGLVGAGLLRFQGLATLARMQAALDQGRAPVREVFDGVCLLIAGLCLLVPGFFSDLIGLALLIPPVRGLLIATLGGYLAKNATTVRFKAEETTIIDGEFEHVAKEESQDDPAALREK